MAALCIGGVCVPYTAVVPFLAILLKWFATKLASLGLLPHSLARFAGVDAAAAAAAAGGGEGSKCCGDETTATATATATARGVVRRVESVDEWRTLLGRERSDDGPGGGEEKVVEDDRGEEVVVVAKFTADWCKPCKRIEPFFERMSAKYDATFVKVDVDELDEIASECGVAMMPTFVVFRGSEKAGSVSGADEGHLERLVAQHASPVAVATSSSCGRRGKGDKKRV